MNLDDPDRYRDERREPPGAGGPHLGVARVMAIVVGVVVVGTLLTILLMASLGSSTPGAILTDALRQLGGAVKAAPELVLVPVLLIGAALVGMRLSGTLAAVLVWTLIGTGVFLVAARLSSPSPRVAHVEGGTLQVERARNGHFELDGRVDGVPVRFLVDTGASITTIPSELRPRLASPSTCVPARFQTAAGPADGCILRVDQIEIEGIRIANVDVAVMPGLRGSGLLGMNVLRRFDIEQRGSTLRLSPPAAPTR